MARLTHASDRGTRAVVIGFTPSFMSLRFDGFIFRRETSGCRLRSINPLDGPLSKRSYLCLGQRSGGKRPIQRVKSHLRVLSSIGMHDHVHCPLAAGFRCTGGSPGCWRSLRVSRPPRPIDTCLAGRQHPHGACCPPVYLFTHSQREPCDAH